MAAFGILRDGEWGSKPTFLIASISAWGRPAALWYPLEITRPFFTRRAPTAGLGPVLPSARVASLIAKRMKRSQQVSHGLSAAAHVVRSGDSHGGGSSVNLSESD